MYPGLGYDPTDRAGSRNRKKTTKMKTLAELKAFCEKNNVRYELNPRYAKDGFYNIITGEYEKVQVGWFFGMNNIAGRKGKSEWNWTWFESIGSEANDDTMFYFSERYSMVNGKSYKGWREDMAANETIERRMAARA